MELLILAALAILAVVLLRGGLGRLPGDISVTRPGLAIRAPIASSCLVSIVASVVLSLALGVCSGAIFR